MNPRFRERTENPTVLAFSTAFEPVWAGSESPQHRFAALGSGALAPAELLALVLAGGEPRAADLELSRNLLSGRTLDDLREMPPTALPSLGLADSQIASLRAAFEIACRLAQGEMPDREPLQEPASVVRYLALRYRDKTQEVLGAIFLDGRRRVITTKDLFRGSMTQVIAETKTVLREALALCAQSLVLFHTHPSGDPSPSPEDLAFTRKLLEACDALEIQLLDHLIIGTGRWVSLKSRGIW
jgi:DNA repair protein RadC